MPDQPKPGAAHDDLFRRLVAGQDGAIGELSPLVYQELRALADSLLRHERDAWSLQPTALVHEAYVRLAGAEERGWRTKARFAAVAARSMRQILVERARRRNAQKRGGDRHRVTLTGVAASASELDVLAVDDLLERLAAVQPRAARVLELDVFANMTGQEISEVLGISRRTIDKDLAIARAWLARELRRDDDR